MVAPGRGSLVAGLFAAWCGGMAAPGHRIADGASPLPDTGVAPTVDTATPLPPDGGVTPPPPDARPTPPPDAASPPPPPPATGAAIEFRLASPLPVTAGGFRVETATLWVGRMTMESDRGGDDGN